MKSWLFVLALVACLIACAHTNPLPGTPECKSYSVEITFSADETFTDTERAGLAAAFDGWRSLSGGRIEMGAFYNSTGGDGHIYRLTGNDPRTTARDAIEAKKFGQPDYKVLGWQEDSPQAVYLVVDRIDAAQMQHLATHELGHAAGLAWPNCQNEPRAPMVTANGKLQHDCDHVADENAVMYPYLNTPHTLGAADLAFCQASCLCDATSPTSVAGSTASMKFRVQNTSL